MGIINKISITNAEAEDVLAKKMKKRELTYEQQLAYEFLKNTAKLSVTNAKKLGEELKELGLKDEQTMNIINLMPEDELTLKLILKKDKELKSGLLKSILGVLKKYK
ncbi:MAG: hypothetical protein KAU95_02745 [Candidatus Aenigmarchaeota archaeon]|nr:hypothetical protein [Candidatus Aenigmarchaeota archaeon]